MSVKYKKELEDIIFSTEIEANLKEVSPISVYEDIATRIKWLDPNKANIGLELKQKIIKKLNANSNPIKVYSNYLDTEVLKLLKETTSNGTSIGSTLEVYGSVKKLSDNLKTSVKTKLKVPFITAFVVVFIMNSIIDGFQDMFHDPSLQLPQTAIFIADHYLLVSLTPLILIAMFVFTNPDKVFGVKKVLAKINSMLILSSTMSLFKSGRTTIDVISFLKRTFNLKGVAGNNRIEYLARMLYQNGHIQMLEAVFLSKVQFSDVELLPLLEEYTERRTFEAKQLGEVIEGVISNFSTLLLLIPFGLAMYSVGIAIFTMVSSIKM